MALDNLLESLVKNDYGRYGLVVADDYSNKVDSHGSSAGDVCKKYKGKFKSLTFCYNEKTQGLGISRNKNRLIREFFKGDYESCLLLDDDVLLIRPGLIEYMSKASNLCNVGHINMYWTDYNPEIGKLTGLSGLQWAEDFPTKSIAYSGDDAYISFARGCHGCGIFITKEMLDQVGYFNTFPKNYGYEHSAFSARMNRLEGFAPELFPTLIRSSRYMNGNCIGNDYSIDFKSLDNDGEQTKYYRQILKDVYNGVNLKVEQPGLPKKGEKVIVI